MMRALARFRAAVGGASAVEFALVATPFLLMIFGAIEYGRLFWTRHAVSQVAMATGRCVAVPQIECASEVGFDAARARVFAQQTGRGWILSLKPEAIAFDMDATCRGLDGFARVTVATTFHSALPELLLALAGGVEIESSACFPRLSG